MLKVFLGYQRIFDRKNIHTFEKGKSQRNQRILWRWKEVCIVIDTMVVAQNKCVRIQKLFKYHPSKEKINMPNIL